MYSVTNLFKTYSKSYDRTIEAKIETSSHIFNKDEIVSFTIEDSVQTAEDFEIGTSVASKLTLELRTNESIASGAIFTPYIRFVGTEGISEWFKLGEFYTDSRTIENKVWKFTCYDRLIYGEQEYISSLYYPTTFQAVWNECCTKMGVTSHSSVTINPTYICTLAPTGHKLREVMGFIAGAHAASVKMMKDGKVGFIKYSAAATVTEKITASVYMKNPQTNSAKIITKVIVNNTENGDDIQLVAGTGDDAKTLVMYNPYMNQTMVNNLQATLNNIRYIPFNMDWKGFPYLELGDVVEIEQTQTPSWLEAVMPWQEADFAWGSLPVFRSILMSNKMTYKGGLKATSGASAVSPQKSETVFNGTIAEQLNALEKVTVREGKRYYGVTIRREDGINVQSTSGGEATFNADKIEMKGPTGLGLYFDAITGKYKFKGDIIMESGSISWENVELPFGEFTDAMAVEAWKNSGYATNITSTGVYTGVIHINTDAVVGNQITLGDPDISSHLDLKNTSNGFTLAISNTDVLRFWSSALWCKGDLALQAGYSIGVFTGGLSSPGWSSLITLWQNEVNVFSNGSGKSLNLYGFVSILGRVGFFGSAPTWKQDVSYPPNIGTTNTASSTYGSTEQSMLNSLKTDVNNLRTNLNNLVNALKNYGLV